MKILVLGRGSYVAGAEIIMLNQMICLRRLNVEIFFLINGWNNGDYPKRLQDLGFKYKEIKLGWFYLNKPKWTVDTLIHLPKALSQFIKVKNKFKPDLIYTSDIRTLALLKYYITEPIVLKVEDCLSSNWQNKMLLNWLKKKIFLYLACSIFIKNDLVELKVINNVKVLYNGIENNTNNILKKTISNKIRIGIVGQIIPKKGHHQFIKAISTLSEKKNIEIHIYGTGNKNYIQGLKEEINTLSISEIIYWKGFVKNITEIYTQLDIVVVPTFTNEPFGLVAAEPAIFKIPVIASNRGGLPEVVIDNLTGYLINPEDEIEFGEKLENLINNMELRNFFGENGFNHVINTFNSEKICIQLFNYFTTIITNSYSRKDYPFL